MRAGRLLSIAVLLQLRERWSASELALEFGVTERTIYRDVAELCQAGVPIIGERGPGGGFRLVEGYRARWSGLGAAEAEAVFLIGLPGAAAALGLGAAARGAGRKVLAALPPTLRDGAGRIGERFHQDPVDWYRTAPATPSLPSLARAVLDQRSVRLKYESWRGQRSWKLEPLGLVQKAGAWYLVARSRRGVRIFKASNIAELVVQEATFERPPGFDLASYWTSALTRFEAQLRPETATLRVSNAGRRRLARLGAYAARAIDEAESPDELGWARLRLPIESIEDAALVLLGIGPEVDVVDPPALRARLRELAAQVVDRLG